MKNDRYGEEDNRALSRQLSLWCTALCGFLLCVLVIFTAGSCSKRGSDPVLPPLSAEDVSAERVWNRIAVQTDYTGYHYWPDHEGLSPGQAPHGVFHKVFINKLLYEALPVSGGEVPNGSIVVKENYSSDEAPAGLTVMVKVDGFHPEHNDWFWASYSMEGKVNIAGQVTGCIDCHAGMRRNDYIIIHPIDGGTD
jgi:hypothetical protein